MRMRIRESFWPGSGMENFRIRDKHSGSATLDVSFKGIPATHRCWVTIRSPEHCLSVKSVSDWTIQLYCGCITVRVSEGKLEKASKLTSLLLCRGRCWSPPLREEWILRRWLSATRTPSPRPPSTSQRASTLQPPRWIGILCVF